MDQAIIQEKISLIEAKRQSLVKLLEKPDLGSLRLDVNQALEELDDLIEDLKITFPSSNL
jgi:hypothetical protein